MEFKNTKKILFYHIKVIFYLLWVIFLNVILNIRPIFRNLLRNYTYHLRLLNILRLLLYKLWLINYSRRRLLNNWLWYLTNYLRMIFRNCVIIIANITITFERVVKRSKMNVCFWIRISISKNSILLFIILNFLKSSSGFNLC